jgi:hypothetical protein
MRNLKPCPRCGKHFNHKGNTFRHLKITHVCPPKYLNVPRYIILNNYDKYYRNYLDLLNEKKKICSPKMKLIKKSKNKHVTIKLKKTNKPVLYDKNTIIQILKECDDNNIHQMMKIIITKMDHTKPNNIPHIPHTTQNNKPTIQNTLLNIINSSSQKSSKNTTYNTNQQTAHCLVISTKHKLISTGNFNKINWKLELEKELKQHNFRTKEIKRWINYIN